MSKSVRVKAIRSAWSVARHAGIEPPASACRFDGIMSRDERVRRAMVRAFECGYRRGKMEAKR